MGKYKINPLKATFDLDSGSGASITDSGNYYTGTTVELALQEIGAGTTLDTRYLQISTAAATYVPYQNATGDVNLGAYALISNWILAPSDDSLALESTNNNVQFIAGYLDPKFYFYAGALAGIFDFTGLTTNDKTFTFPDASGTLALTSDISYPVTSVFTRTGAVVAATNDYTWAQINKATSSIADITTRSHTSLTDIGANTHAQLDTFKDTTVPATYATLAGTLAQFAATTSLQLKGVISDETGSGALVFATSPTLVTPLLGTPTSGILTNCTGLPMTTGVTGTLPVANGGTGVTSSTGTVAVVLSTSPTLVTPLLGTPTSGVLTNCTGLPISTGVSNLGANVATFLATPSSANLLAAVTNETGTGVLMFATSPTITTSLILPDSTTVLLGTGSDGELFHDGINTYFQNNTGDIIIENDASDGDITLKVNDGGVDTTVMTIDGATGYIGIGLTPSYPLDIAKTFTDTSGTLYSSLITNYAYPSADVTAGTWAGISVQVATEPLVARNFTAPATLFGMFFNVEHYSTGTVAMMMGVQGKINNRAGGIITAARGLFSIIQNISTGTITTGYGLYLGNPVNSGGGTFTTFYGIYLGTPSAAGTNYACSFGGGLAVFNEDGTAAGDFRIEGDTNANLFFTDASADCIGIGISTPNANAILDITSTTKAFMPPRMTTTQRDAIASPTEGMVIWNSTTHVLNCYYTSWVAV